jgi:hypothetical protein
MSIRNRCFGAGATLGLSGSAMKRGSIRRVPYVIACVMAATVGLAAQVPAANAEVTRGSCAAEGVVTQGLVCSFSVSCPTSAVNGCDTTLTLTASGLLALSGGIAADMITPPSEGPSPACGSNAAANPSCSVSIPLPRPLIAGRNLAPTCSVSPVGPLALGVGSVYTGVMVQGSVTCSIEMTPR